MPVLRLELGPFHRPELWKVISGMPRPVNVIVNGDVTGDIHSSRHIELAAKANVMGNVYYHTIEMVKGAHINGNLVFQQANVIKLEAAESRI